ncbi:MAG: SUMF1/EgtB/PvdO family nonheme iron enzyme [Candidatus Tectimicrobiota bacterium]
MAQIELLRIVVASPSDVQAEREAVDEIVQELNRTIAAQHAFRCEVSRWEVDGAPGMHPAGPSGLIEPVLDLEHCALVLGIFWKVFGTPVQDALSGTEHALRRAYALWQQQGQPQIMLYFKQQPYMPQSLEEIEQQRRVLTFRQGLPDTALAWEYRNKAQFVTLARQHLTRFLQQVVPRQVPAAPPGKARPGGGQRTTARVPRSGAAARGRRAVAAGQDGIAVGGGVQNSVLMTGGQAHVYLPPAGPEQASQEARRRYLERLRRLCQALPLASLGADPGSEQELTLEAVYIELHTTTAVPAPAEPAQPPARLRDPATRPLTALEAFAQHPRLVLLGDPGSGKSTFVRQLLAWLASAQLEHRPGPPGCAADLVPVLITARDLAPVLEPLALTALSEARRRECLVEAVREHVLAELAGYDASGFDSALRSALSRGHCLLVLDGLDEVPSALRQRLREAVQAVLQTYAPARLLLTCRVRSYVGEAVLAGVQVHTLAAFNQEQIGTFARAWYRAQQTLGHLDARQAEAKAAALAQAAAAEELRELASNPMMLTTMAIIHQRDIGLPRERVRLYTLVVDVLLRRWQQGKTGQVDSALHPGLAAVLGEERRLLPLLQALAYAAQRSRQGEQTVSDVPRPAALALLERAEYLGDVGLASAFLLYVDHRAGLLMGRGGAPERPETYSFPHRVFQEYLAACHLLRQRSMVRTLLAHAREGEQWNLVVQLAAEELLYNLQRDNELLDLAYDLCPLSAWASPVEQRTVLWSAQMAVLLGQEAIQRDTERLAGGAAYLTRLRAGLVRVIGGDLTAPERAEAGKTLALLGEPRFRTEAWSLPAEPLLGLVAIPAGPFVMGSEAPEDSAWLDATPSHRVTLPTYYIARYPVTVAQFQAFVRARGYKPDNPNSLHGVANHPVAWVTWHDAVAYCHWLTACLRDWPETPEPLATLLRHKGWRVMLPSEAEWEKAARGDDGRWYPWGNDEPDASRANYVALGLGDTSTVGCFPAGASPYGVEDLSGNVWEWTRSKAGTYPYPATRAARQRREDLQGAQDEARVLRGGAFWYAPQYVRCPLRLRFVARLVHHDAGFRVVLAAGLP